MGTQVKAGEVIARMIDPLTGAVTAAKAPSDGVMFARIAQRFVTKGMRLAQGRPGTTRQADGHGCRRRTTAPPALLEPPSRRSCAAPQDEFESYELALGVKRKAALEGRPFHCRSHGPIEPAISWVTHQSRKRQRSRSRKPGTVGYNNETLDHLLSLLTGNPIRVRREQGRARRPRGGLSLSVHGPKEPPLKCVTQKSRRGKIQARKPGNEG